MSCVICGGADGKYGIGRYDWEMESVADLCDLCAYRLVPALEAQDRERLEARKRELEARKQYSAPEAVAVRAALVQQAQERFMKKLERERRADARAVAKFDKGIV